MKSKDKNNLNSCKKSIYFLIEPFLKRILPNIRKIIHPRTKLLVNIDNNDLEIW